MRTTIGPAGHDPAIVTEIIAGFRAAFGELRCMGSERLHRAGVSMTHFHLLSMLDRHGDMAMSRIAELLDVSLSNATGLVDRIEERGFVERVRVADDRRVVQVRLTAAGVRLLQEVELLKDDMLQRILGKLDDTALAGVSQAVTDLRGAVEEVVRDDPTAHFHQHDHRHAPPAPPRA